MIPRGLRAAFYYVDHWGVPVVPVEPGTRWSLMGPTGPGHRNATSDKAILTDLWVRYPHADAAVASTDKLVVIDVDAKHGFDGRDTLADLEERYGPLPEAPTATTPNGGLHYYFRAVADVRSSVARLGTAVDVRGKGSLLFPPPCRGYSYWIGYSAADLELPELPAGWIAALRRLEDGRGEPGEPFVLPDEIGAGGRNDTLFRYAASMRAREVPVELIEGALRKANRERCAPPLGDREITTILRSVSALPAGRSSIRRHQQPSIRRGHRLSLRRRNPGWKSATA